MVCYASEDGNTNNLIVIRVDGGICSQLAFVALGTELARKGYRVKYDLSWFRTCGKDLTGKFVRNWDMPRAFPSLDLAEATEAETNLYRKRFRRRGDNIFSYAPPLYVDGYPERERVFVSHLPELRAAFRPDLDGEALIALEQIRAVDSCAVHVRRGDLANGDPAYGRGTSVEYYRRALLCVAALRPGMRFFFFSDEPSWVRENLVPLVPVACGSRVMDLNGSDRGYVDLCLISNCRCVISSIGSLGVFGALLSPRTELLVMSTRRTWVADAVDNVLYLNDDRGHVMGEGRTDLLAAIPESRLRGLGWCVYRLWRRLGEWLCGGMVKIECPPRRY